MAAGEVAREREKDKRNRGIVRDFRFEMVLRETSTYTVTAVQLRPLFLARYNALSAAPSI
jgi:hypothetical protein